MHFKGALLLQDGWRVLDMNILRAWRGVSGAGECGRISTPWSRGEVLPNLKWLGYKVGLHLGSTASREQGTALV